MSNTAFIQYIIISIHYYFKSYDNPYLLNSVSTNCGETDVVLLYNGGVKTVKVQQQDVLVIESYNRAKVSSFIHDKTRYHLALLYRCLMIKSIITRTFLCSYLSWDPKQDPQHRQVSVGRWIYLPSHHPLLRHHLLPLSV